jgi:hypothetical protein
MINKIYKRIHNKYLNLFKFFYFLRYVFVIFIISTSLFLLVPKFFNYEKKREIINEYLNNHLDLESVEYTDIVFKVFPFPNLSLQNVNLKIKNKPINLKSKNINIFLNLKNIYNYRNFKAKKVILNENEIYLEINRAKDLINYFKKLKHNLDIKSLNINFTKSDSSLIKIKNINFSNHGYQKYYFNGDIFNKKFKASLKNNNRELLFKLLNTGVKAKIKLNEKVKNNFAEGSSKINLSNNLLKFNFTLNNNQLKIFKSNFRNKNLSFSLDSLIKFNPFFIINSNLNIDEIDKNLIEKLNLKKIIYNKEIIKKLNSEININFKSKKYFINLIETYSSNFNLAFGRLVFSNKILFAGGEMSCQASSKLIEKYPSLNFVCSFNIYSTKKLLKKFSISKKLSEKSLRLNVEGSLNLLNEKINFKKINVEKSYLANDEDKRYFKETFERILFNDGFFKIFNKNKIGEFILEII